MSAQRRCAASTGEQPAQVRSRPRSALQPPRGRQVTDPKATPRKAARGRRGCRGAGPGARSWAPSRSEGGRGHPSGRRSSHGTCHSRQVARPRWPFGLTRGGPTRGPRGGTVNWQHRKHSRLLAAPETSKTCFYWVLEIT